MIVKDCEACHLQVHDGPGLVSPLLGHSQHNHRNDTYRTLKTEIRHYSSFNEQTKVDEEAVSPTCSERIGFLGNHFHCRNTTLCFVKLTTDPRFKVKISIVDMRYRGQNNTPNCLYAGVAVYENETEIGAQCVKPHHVLETKAFDENVYVYPSIYSNGSSVLLVLYSYKIYGALSLILAISSTKCRAIPLNVCDVHTDVQVIYDLFFTQAGRFDVNVTSDECVIVQLGSRTNKRAFLDSNVYWSFVTATLYLPLELERCQAEIRLRSKTDKAHKYRNVELSATGFFRGKKHEPFTSPSFVDIHILGVVKSCVFVYFCTGQFDNLFLHGVPRKFCHKEFHRSDNKSWEKCDDERQAECKPRHGYGGEIGTFKFFIVHWKDNIHKFQLLNDVSGFEVNVSAAVHVGTPYFTVVFVGNNHGSWVDIEINLTADRTIHSTRNKFDEQHLSETFLLPGHSKSKAQTLNLETTNLLWFHADMQENTSVYFLNLWVQNILPYTRHFEIKQMEWRGNIRLSQEKPQYCVSLPGRVSTVTLTPSGKKSLVNFFTSNVRQTDRQTEEEGEKMKKKMDRKREREKREIEGTDRAVREREWEWR